MGKNNTFSDTAANRYSLALYELAEENKSVHEIEDQSAALIQLIDDSKNFESLIKNPINKKEEQINHRRSDNMSLKRQLISRK